MDAEVTDDDWTVEPELVEVVARQTKLTREPPPPAPHPRCGWLQGRMLGKGGQYGGDVARHGEIGPARVQGSKGQMVVSVDEAREECAPAKVNEFDVRAVGQERPWAGRRDAVTVDDQDLGRIARLHRCDPSTAECHRPHNDNRMPHRCRLPPRRVRADQEGATSELDEH
jgi:hypothetical protein